jgi:hypothetical protein
LDRFLTSFPGLEEFRLEDNHPFKDYPAVHLNLSHPKLKVLSLLKLRRLVNEVRVASPNLQVLEIAIDDYHYTGIHVLEISPEAELIQLNLQKIRIPLQLQYLHAQCKRLQSLSLESPFIRERDFIPILKEGKQLRFLRLECEGVTDNIISLLTDNKNLQFLDIGGNYRASGSAVIKLVERLCKAKGGKLSEIHAPGIENLSRQTIDWAWNKGVKIRF